MVYSENDLKALCWEEAKVYFDAMDRSHISRMIDHAVRKQYANTEEPKGAE